MALSIDLGRSDFCSLGSNLNLTQHATAFIIPPPDTGTRESELEELLQHGALWVNQAPEFKIHIHVRVGPDIVRPASMFFLQIGEIFCHSQLWQDLGLNVLFKSCEHAESDYSTTFQLSFGLRRKAKQSRTPRTLRIPTRMRSTYDALPPDGIPTAYLSSIDLSLVYERSDQWTQRDTARSTMTEGIVGNLRHLAPGKSTDNNGHDDILFEVTCLHVEYPRPPAGLTIADKKDITEFAEELRGPEDQWCPLSSFPPKSCSPPPVAEDIYLDKQFHTLFDVGFRNLIAEDQRSMNRGVEISRDESSRSLSTISPSVFSFGYREAMNQRSEFIPSIASPIASMLEHTKNPDLQHRKRTLKSLHSSQPGSSPATDRDTSIFKATIKQSLWKIAQRRLYNTAASKTLPPLESISTSCREYPKMEHTTLFERSEVEQPDYNSESHGSDYYIGDETEEFKYLLGQHDQEKNAEDEEAELSSLLSLPDDHSDLAIDMFQPEEPPDLDIDQPTLDETIDTTYKDDPFYNSNNNNNTQTPTYPLSPLHPPSDNEMLKSDCIETDSYLDGPVFHFPPMNGISIDMGEFLDYDYDDMLCD